MAISRLGWHFLANDKKLRHGNGTQVVIGKKLEWRDSYEKKYCKINDVHICSYGMHASSLIGDAEEYAKGYIYSNLSGSQKYGWLCRVKVDGTNYDARNHAKGRDHEFGKFVGTHRTVLGMVPVSWLIDTFGTRDVWDEYHDEIIHEMVRRNKRNKNPTKVR